MDIQEPIEPILDRKNDRFVLHPIIRNDIWELQEKQEGSFWTVKEVDLSSDLNDWNKKLNDDERFFIKMVLAFFAASDGIVMENLASRFFTEVAYPEARQFYAFQIHMESVHSEMYSILISTYISDSKERNRLFTALDTYPFIGRKASWAIKWINEQDHFATRLIAFCIVEGVFFSGSFCSIYWLKKRGLMPGLCASNQLISRDEGLHCDFACLLYKNHIMKKLDQKVVHSIMDEAVSIELEFISSALPVELIGMNSKQMSIYIKFVADRLLTSLGYEAIYGEKNPFDWMDMISVSNKDNFFERRVTEYNSASILGNIGERDFDLNADF